MRDQFSGGDYKYCCDCFHPMGDKEDKNCVEFYKEGRGWQYQIRCIHCEQLYVQKFKDKYPNTKPVHRTKKMTPEQQTSYSKWQKSQRDFRDYQHLVEEELNDDEKRDW